MSKSNTSDRVLNVVLLVILLGAMALPDSPVRAYVTTLAVDWRTKSAIESEWDRLAATTSRLDDAQDQEPIIVEFGDYSCPFCRDFHSMSDTASFKDLQVTIAYRHYPLTDIHPHSDGAARAAICAEFQDRFREMHNLLFTTEDWPESRGWRQLAREAGVPNLDDFERCLSSDAVRKRLEDDIELANALGVSATPTFVGVGGRLHVGSMTSDQMRDFLSGSR